MLPWFASYWTLIQCKTTAIESSFFFLCCGCEFTESCFLIDPGFVKKVIKKCCWMWIQGILFTYRSRLCWMWIHGIFYRDFQAPEKTYSFQNIKCLHFYTGLSAISDVLGTVSLCRLNPNPIQIRNRHSALFSSCKSGLCTTFFQLSFEKWKGNLTLN